MNFSFIYPDRELSVLIIRLLIILKHNSLNNSNKPILSLEKISAFSFLLEHPYVLYRILVNTNKRAVFVANEIERNSISTEFPNTQSLYSFQENKMLLAMMISRKLAKVILIEDKPFYLIDEQGLTHLNNITTEYTERLNTISENFRSLHSKNYKDLLKMITPYTNGK